MVFNSFLRPQSSYERPVPLVLVDPDVDATAVVCFNPEWMPYVLGSLQQLVQHTTWDTQDEDELLQQIARASLLIAQFTTPCGGEPMLQVRQSEESPCTLEQSVDGGETWTSFADMQLCPPRIRTNKGKTQWFNGEAWVDVPGGGDERYDGESEPQWITPPSGESGDCLAAENIVASYVTMLTQTKSGLDAVLAISGIVDVVAGYIGTQTLFPPALIILEISIVVGALAEIGATAIEDLIESPDVDTLKCIISCHASEDGAFTAAEFDAIQDDVSSQIDEPTRTIMSKWLDSYGPVGLTRAAASNGITDGDCSDCDCDAVTAHMLFDLGSIDSPRKINAGETWTIHSGNNAGANQYCAVEFSACIKATVISYTGWVIDTTPGGNPAWRDCAGTDHNTMGGDQPPTYLAPELHCTRMYFGGLVSSPFSVTIRFDDFV